MSNLDDAIAKAKAGQPSYYSFKGVEGLMPLHKLTPQQLDDLRLIEQRSYGSAGLPLQKPVPHILNPVSGFTKFMNTGPSGKKEGRPKYNEEMDEYEDFIDKYHNKINYNTPSILDGLNITPELQGNNQISPEELLLQHLNQRGLA